MSLETGTIAPDFTLPTDGNGEVTLSQLRGKPVVVYFYPKDNTPGCTTEASDFRDKISDFEALGATIIGISKDSVKKHDNFKAKHELNFILGSDEHSDVCENYTVWVEKKMYGKTYMGIERATFLVDPEGKIAGVWRKVKVKGHVDAVLEAASKLA